MYIHVHVECALHIYVGYSNPMIFLTCLVFLGHNFLMKPFDHLSFEQNTIRTCMYMYTCTNEISFVTYNDKCHELMTIVCVLTHLLQMDYLSNVQVHTGSC